MVYAMGNGIVWGLGGFVVALIFGAVTAIIAKSKGHTAVWGIVGFLLPIIGLVIVLLLRRRPDVRR